MNYNTGLGFLILANVMLLHDVDSIFFPILAAIQASIGVYLMIKHAND